MVNLVIIGMPSVNVTICRCFESMPSKNVAYVDSKLAYIKLHTLRLCTGGSRIIRGSDNA